MTTKTEKIFKGSLKGAFDFGKFVTKKLQIWVVLIFQRFFSDPVNDGC